MVVTKSNENKGEDTMSEEKGKYETGKQYTSTDTFPSNIAHTYTKVS